MAGNQAFGRKLASLRGKITQEEVATAIGISRARYSHYETGRSEPDNEILQALAEYYDVTSDYLLGLKETPNIYVEVSSDTEAINAVFPVEGRKEINIYNLIPRKKEEIFAPENIIGTQLVPTDSIYTKGFKAIDNSMSGSQILIGTNVLIEEDDSPLDGEIVVAQVPGNTELLIRRYTTANDEITLIPDNSSYKPLTFRANEIRIIGIVTDLHTHIGRKSK